MTASGLQVPCAATHVDAVFGCEAVKVLPGEYHVTDRDIALVTVLGSCVAACIRDVALGLGGMNHFMLPDPGAAVDANAAPARYGSYAMEVLINSMIKRGARRGRLEAKVFGGANVMPGMSGGSVGRRNAAFVLDYLATERIRVVAWDLEADCARKVVYFPRTGVVRLRRLVDVAARQLARQETRYKTQLSRGDLAGAVELFG